MVKHAVILMPDSPSGLSPPVMARVAGLPLLYRQIYGLWRAGVHTVTVIADHEACPWVEAGLVRLTPRGAVKVVSDWQAVWRQTADDGDSPRLVLVAEVFPIPRVLGEFARLSPEEGALAIAVVLPEAADRPASGPVHPVFQAVVENSLIKSVNLALSWDQPLAAGLALFSGAAWQEFRRWEEDLRTRSLSCLSPAGLLFGFIGSQARKGKVKAVFFPGAEITLIRQERDLALAERRLVAGTEGSPWGEGYLESSINRRLARKVLPHFLTSRLTPNEITGLDLLVGLAAVALFIQGAYWANVGAALLLLVVIFLDTLDGLLARLTFRESRLGVRLDLYGDTILNFMVFAGIALGQYRVSGHPVFLLLLIPLTLGYWGCWKVLNPLKPAAQEQPELGPSIALKAPDSGLKGRLMAEATSRDFFYLILVAALLDILDWLIMATAVGTVFFAVWLHFYQRHSRI